MADVQVVPSFTRDDIELICAALKLLSGKPIKQVPENAAKARVLLKTLSPVTSCQYILEAAAKEAQLEAERMSQPPFDVSTLPFKKKEG